MVLSNVIYVSCDYVDTDCEELPSSITVGTDGYQLDETYTVLELKPKIHSFIFCEAYLTVSIYGMKNKQHIIDCLREKNPFRDLILVEKRIPRAYAVPYRDGIFCRYFVPDGTSDLVDDQAFYQYFVPNGTLQTITS